VRFALGPIALILACLVVVLGASWIVGRALGPLGQRKLALVSGSFERLGSTLDAVGETAFALDRQRSHDLIDAGRGAMFDRRFVIDVSFPKIPSDPDSHRKTESSHH